MDSKRWVMVVKLIAVLILVVGAVGLSYSIYGRLRPLIALSGNVIQTEGVITEKLTESRSDRLLPFDVETYIIRYTFPTPERGQVRSGEQLVTQRVYNNFNQVGEIVTVTFRQDDPGINALDPIIRFSGTIGWRMGIVFGMIFAGILLAFWLLDDFLAN